MEKDAEIHTQALGQPPEVQLNRGRRDYKSKRGQGHDGETLPDSW